jgi:hypothetical protein
MQHSHNHLFNSENQTNALSYTTFPVKKMKVEKKNKIMRILMFNYSFYSHPAIGKFQGVGSLNWTFGQRFEPGTN